MWYGEYAHTLDEKDRFILPAKFRQKLKDLKKKKFYITRGLDECLFLFTQDIWEELEKKFKSLPFTKQQARFFNRFMFGSVQEVDVDSQGRVIIPVYLKKFAQIKREVVIVGVGDRVEVWDKQLWERFYQGNKKRFEEAAESLF